MPGLLEFTRTGNIVPGSEFAVGAKAALDNPVAKHALGLIIDSLAKLAESQAQLRDAHSGQSTAASARLRTSIEFVEATLRAADGDTETVRPVVEVVQAGRDRRSETIDDILSERIED